MALSVCAVWYAAFTGDHTTHCQHRRPAEGQEVHRGFWTGRLNHNTGLHSKDSFVGCCLNRTRTTCFQTAAVNISMLSDLMSLMAQHYRTFQFLNCLERWMCFIWLSCGYINRFVEAYVLYTVFVAPCIQTS